jgi:hypothetical protein
MMAQSKALQSNVGYIDAGPPKSLPVKTLLAITRPNPTAESARREVLECDIEALHPAWKLV